MARGGSKHRGGMRGGGRKNKYSHEKNKGRGKFNQKPYHKQDSSQIKTFGKAHPSEDADGEHSGPSSKRRKIIENRPNRPPAKEESSDDDDEQVNSRLHDPYTQLLSTFSSLDQNLQKKAIESDESEDDTDASDEEGGSDEEPTGVNIEPQNTEDVLHDKLNSESDEALSSDESLTSVKSESVTECDSTDDENLSASRPSPKFSPKLNGTELQEEDVETSKEEEPDESLDPFTRHFYYDMDDVLYETVSKEPPDVETFQQNWPVLGQLQIQLPKTPDSSELSVKTTTSKIAIIEEKKFAEHGTNPTRISSLNWSELHIKPQISNNISKANSCNIMKREASSPFTPLQKELFSLVRNYQDVYFPYRTLANGEEVRFLYCLHAVNHVLKTRSKIIHHNARLAKKDDVPEEFRDQGLMRPKVVILVPFRESALRVVKMITAILFQEEKANVMHMKRFVDEHSGEEISMPKKNPRPEDYEATFAGNTDDTFRIGMTVTKKSLKLYADFYSADIIVASPLGLRVIVGAEGEPERDFDFLAAIELLVLDQTELFLMQNWDHLLHVLDHFHLQPKEAHGTDFSRVRSWALNGWARYYSNWDHLLHVLDHFHLQPKEAHGTDFSRVRSWALNGWARYYRQTLVFSSLVLPEINALFNRKCHNYAGKVRVVNPVAAGTICQVVVQLPQVFHRFDATSATQAIDARLDFFVKKILPRFKDSTMTHTMVYVPSYFDFVCLRNYFKREDISFVQICEYSKDGKVARARDMFFHTDAHFLLYSERFHFFRRFRIKGIRNLVFYQPPTFPHLYSEMCNLMHEANQNKWSGNEGDMTVSVLYSKYDVQQLAALVGTDRAKRMMSSDRSVHMFMTGE